MENEMICKCGAKLKFNNLQTRYISDEFTIDIYCHKCDFRFTLVYCLWDADNYNEFALKHKEK